MANERTLRDDQLNSASTSNKARLTAATTITPLQKDVVCDSTDGAFAVTLPFPEEAPGVTFSVYLAVDNGDVTVVDQAASPTTYATLTAVADFTVIYCTGTYFLELASTET